MRVPNSTFTDQLGEASRGGEAAEHGGPAHHFTKTDYSHSPMSRCASRSTSHCECGCEEAYIYLVGGVDILG